MGVPVAQGADDVVELAPSRERQERERKETSMQRRYKQWAKHAKYDYVRMLADGFRRRLNTV